MKGLDLSTTTDLLDLLDRRLTRLSHDAVFHASSVEDAGHPELADQIACLSNEIHRVRDVVTVLRTRHQIANGNPRTPLVQPRRNQEP